MAQSESARLREKLAALQDDLARLIAKRAEQQRRMLAAVRRFEKLDKACVRLERRVHVLTSAFRASLTARRNAKKSTVADLSALPNFATEEDSQ